ncbi:transcriptional regulator [Actinomadura craniellae]|uniref:Transcriptional regulator n=1 Tax=Actinomadura craniellae TaxID=2231787 RepID=A0A365H6I8_9ACTN|nr:transcriptional regulator [Actinomadura craniellae]RAY14691.1 transcriptional regulator [Actinomadura craniellae]
MKARAPATNTPPVPHTDDVLQALELARRAAASDVCEATLHALETAVDDLATAYPRARPGDLLERVRRHLSYTARLLDGRKTLSEHRRLLVAGGWLSLLASTCHIDLRQFPAATTRLRTAEHLAREGDHPEILAWCLETQAWRAITGGDYRHAVTLSQSAQQIAPKGGSAYVQASAQEGRAWARLGGVAETRVALAKVNRLAAGMPAPDRPEHHYRYDPAKSDAYTATTLAWVGDPAAEPYARQVLARMESGIMGAPRPRRAASARLDLALALLAADKPDEAARHAMTAVTSGVLVPSNHWRAEEVITAIQARDLPETADLVEAYQETCGAGGLPPATG